MHVSSGWDPDAFREYVLGHARKSGRASDQASLAKATGIGTDLLGRYFRGAVQPGPANIQRIQATIPGTTYEHLMVLAGRATADQVGLSGSPTPPPSGHPVAERVTYLLGDASPLEAADRDQLEGMLQRLLDSFHSSDRRRTA